MKISRPHKFQSISQSHKGLTEFFGGWGYALSMPIDVVRKDERTLFASAAGQVFDDAIYAKTSKSPGKIFCIQPVIRLQGSLDVGRKEGISTSFLNAATDYWNATPEQHFASLDCWFDLFSRRGFYAGNLTLRRSIAENDWGGMKVPAHSLTLNYFGLEIGIANYFFDIFQPNGKSATMSDISIGFERFVWGINKTESYFDAIGPLSHAIRGNTVIMDTLRTLTLMASSGITPAHKNHGSKFRLLAKKITQPSALVPIQDLIRHYYAQWSEYVQLQIMREQAQEIIAGEIDRNANLALNKLLRDAQPFDLPHESYLEELLAKENLNISRLRQLFKNNRY